MIFLIITKLIYIESMFNAGEDELVQEVSEQREYLPGKTVFTNCKFYYAAFTDLNSKKICVPLLFSSFIVPPNCCVRREIS